MAHRRSKKDLILDDQGILLDDDEPIRQRRDVTFDDSHPFTDEPTLNLSEFEDSIKEEIEYGEGGASGEESGGDGLNYGAGFEPAAFRRVRAGSQTQDSLDEFEAIEQNLLQDGSHASALFERSREDSRDDISFHSNENSVADQYEQYLSEQEHSRSGNEFSPGGEQHSPGLDDFAAKYGSQSARSYDGQYANEEGVEEDVSRLVGEESFPRNSFLDSSLLNDTVIPINASDSTYDKTPQPTFDHSKNSTPSPSNRRVSDLQSAGDHLVPPSKTPLTSTPNSPTDSKRPDISVQSVREDDSGSRTPVGRPGSDLSPYSGFHERVSEIAKRDAAILRPRFTTYGAETKFSPPKTQRTPPTTDSGKKASNVSFKIDRSSGRILGVSQSTPQSDPSKNTSLRDRRRRNRMSRGESGSRSKRRTETDASVSDLDLDTSGRSDISRSELSQRLKEEVKSKTETSEQLRELQEEYDNLLAKYALAEVTIDHLRLGAKVNLYSDPPKPAPAFVGSIPQPHKIQMVDIPRSQRAQMDRTVEHRSQAVTATLSPPQPSHSRLTQTGMAVGTGTDPFVGEGEEDPTLTATASGESLKVALLLQAASLEDQVDSFEALLDLDQLNQAEQDEVLTRLQAENDRLNQDYLDARDEHDRRRRAGDTHGEFDEDKSVAGKLHQLGMRLEDLGERVENNRNNPTPDTTQQDTAPSLRDSVTTEDSLIQSQMDLPLGEELEEQKRRVEEEFGRLMDRYSQLKGMPRTPDRDREIQELMQQLQDLRRDAPLSLDLPEDLDDSLSQLSSPQLEETDLPEEERSRLPSRLLGRTPGQPSDQDMTRLDQSSLQFSPDSPDRKENHRQRDQVSEDDTPPVVRPKDRRNTSHSRAPKSQNKDDVPSPDNMSNCRLTESRRSSTLFQPCRQSSHLPKPILKTQEHPIQHSHNLDRCDRCGQPLQSQPSTHVGSTSSVADSGRSSPTHRPVAKATQNQPQQEAEIDSGFIGSESSRQSQMTTPLVPKRDPRATRERHRSPVTAQVTQKPSRPGSGHRSVTKHRPAPLQQVSDSDSPEERPTTVREVQPARTGGKKNQSKPQDMMSQRRRPPSTRSRSSNTSHKRHYSSSEDDISRRSVASSRGSSRDDAIQGLKREIENMREELDDRLRRAQNRDRPGKSGLPSTPREPVRAYPMEGSYLEEEDDRREASRPGSLKGPYTGKDYTPYATRRRAPLSETSPMDARDLRSSHSRTRTPSPVGSERRSARRTRDRSTSPLNDTRPKELGRSDLGYTPRSYVRTTGPCPLCGGSGVHTHGEYVHPPPEPVEYRYVPVSSTAPVSPVVHYVPVSPRYVPTTPRTLRYEEVAPSPGVVYSPYPSPVVYMSPRRGRVRYYQRKYSVTETEEEEGDTDDELRLSHLHLGSSLERAERAAREMKRRSRKMANTLDSSLSRSKAKLSAIDWY
ncbi:PREDICTED: AT-hook-containing transcription factor-like [Branchiostoma belcheri]|uniref:AT-hook-containing transcription factor-like n=1 Tax=Branchiostoma belcheri TaxID=7741 RepID=A0A6P5AFC4_BRABE|nr:PREDICTED: AT-hook-containing transcription factor-like [Branchiostoma belcheri]